MTQTTGPAGMGGRILVIFIGAVIILVGLAYCGGRL